MFIKVKTQLLDFWQFISQVVFDTFTFFQKSHYTLLYLIQISILQRTHITGGIYTSIVLFLLSNTSFSVLIFIYFYSVYIFFLFYQSSDFIYFIYLSPSFTTLVHLFIMADNHSPGGTELKDTTSCNIFLEEFVDTYGVALTDACPDCGIRGTRHIRSPNTGVGVTTSITGSSLKGILNPASAAFIKLQNQFPEFSKNGDTRTFLKRLELILQVNLGDSIKQSEWPRVFIHIVKDQSSAEWIMENIINKKLNWEESKKLFLSHFQRAEYSSLLMKKFKSCKQMPSESVQCYSDRFTDICNELERDDSDTLVLQHYLDGLHYDIRRKFESWLAAKRLDQGDVSYQITSLTKLINICIIYDVDAKTTAAAVYSSNSNSKSNSDKQHSHSASDKKKWCNIHKSSTHNTSECRMSKLNEHKSGSSNSSGSISSIPVRKDKSNIKCVKCHMYGHYANECSTKPISQSTSSSNSSSVTTTINNNNNNNQSQFESKRHSAPPSKFTYDKLGTPTAGNSLNVGNKAAQLVSDDSSGNGKLSPERVWLFDGKRNRQFRTLVDTGADISFMDINLAK